jgi:hypothetical protein
MIPNYSQASQDIFVLKMLNQKRNGFFLEIGSNDPIIHNNSYLLEKDYNWKGLMVEYDKSFETSYLEKRPHSIYQLDDARNVNYKQLLDENEFPINIDYLQIDLDVNNKSTLETLLLLNDTIFDKYKFATITFEHDIYSGNYFNTRELSREIFSKRGYTLLFPDVSVYWEGEYKPFEDWYVYPDLIDKKLMDNVKSDVSLTHYEIINRLRKI